MRAIVTTLLAVALSTAAWVFASAADAQLPPVTGPALTDVPLDPATLPAAPPPLPEVKVPELPLATPSATSVPVEPPVPAATPALPDLPAATEGASAAAEAEAASSSQRESINAGAVTSARTPTSRRARGTARRADSRPARQLRRRPRNSTALVRARQAAASRPGLARAVSHRADPRPAAAPPHSRLPAPSLAARVSDDIGELVRALPAAVLWALLGIAAIAIGLAANAFWQSRQRAALEIQRAELLDDIGLLSRALLPPIPEALDGLAVSAAYRPADGPAAGGDFYDVFTVSEQRICILLGDVSGHGRESVTQAALARYTLRTLLAAGHAPGEALARADELLARDLRPNFVTVIAGVYDPGTSEFTYAKAGHAPPIILGAEHDPDAERPVPPIGLRVGDTWPEYRMRLCEGVSICLFTDGLEDARIGDARVGRDQIARMLAAQVVPDAERLLGDLEHLADRITDDTAAVVLSRPPKP
jgi:hypothetical protein